MSKLVHIGTEALGPTNVRLFGDPSTGSGAFSAWTGPPNQKDLPAITVGLDAPGWTDCFAVLNHEVYEYLMWAYGCRFTRSGDIAGNSAAYYFWMDHQQFAEICANAAYFIGKVAADLHKAYQHHKKKK